ncbi:Nn.00g114320.m01.CDS01 [Neocucurbitaria sp. VM-36]
MSTGEDDDLKLQRASASLLAGFNQLLPRLLRKRSRDGTPGRIRQQVRDVDMYKACALWQIEPFQEEPQILDSHLQVFIRPLVDAYLEAIQVPSKEDPKKGFVPLSHAICYLINIFCKVRGEKIIKGFLNNEPRYLELILNELETREHLCAKDDDANRKHLVFPWVERYVLLLWLSHLLLAPFPLDSISGRQRSAQTSAHLEINLTQKIPEVTLRVLTICVERLQSASKERGAAANLLVRLCIRPDMQNVGLLKTLVNWSLTFFSNVSENKADIHKCLGVLSFLSGLVASATNDEVGPFLAAIYRCCQNILDQESLAFIKSSAVARKLVIKTLRNIVLHCLQATSTPLELDPTSTVEEVIEFLLEALADGDSPVRYGASKALSIITLKLDPEMADEVVVAVLDSLTENVYWQNTKRNLNSVNPLRWHGLTLTLSQLLYRKAISTSHLSNVLNALLLSLGFEQRSPTGGSIGTNVRDAACFGIWALSRRYGTADLLAVSTASIRASEERKNLSVTQVLAIELVVAACLDPAGNIRRGSSAALQELIGRHPNTIKEGIPLVQIVDFHAVGLRQRAVCEVAVKAGKLQPLYWQALFENLLDWKGTASLDSDSRLFAAKAVGLLSKAQPTSIIRQMTDQVRSKLAALKPREVEERQGLVSTLAALAYTASLSSTSGNCEAPQLAVSNLWTLLDGELKLEEKAFTSPTLRPEFTAGSICNFIGAMAALVPCLPEEYTPSDLQIAEIMRIFNLCLTRHEDSVLEPVKGATPAILRLLRQRTNTGIVELLSVWLSKLETETSHNGLRCSGHAIALGAAYTVLDDQHACSVDSGLQSRIIKVLTFRCTPAVAIEARIVALRALGILLNNYCTATASPSTHLAADAEAQIGSALHIALNDYTITERGDVGSLVRLEALNTIMYAWDSDILRNATMETSKRIYADILRLSLEKLDKIRFRAARLIQKNRLNSLVHAKTTTTDDVSSRTYFTGALDMLRFTGTETTFRESICVGFISAAGMGTESVVQNSRAALLDFMDTLPVESNSNREEFTSNELVSCMMNLMKQHLAEDRVLLPLLEVIAFLFDMQVIQHLVLTSFNFRMLLSYTQKAHFKSTHMQKLHLALDVYRGLGTIPTTRVDTLAKVISMLLHPFPKIRTTAAETLWVLTQDQDLRLQDWSLPLKSLKPIVDNIRKTSGDMAV